MSVTTVSGGVGYAGVERRTKSGPSFLRRAFDRMIEARTVEGQVRVQRHLQTLDQATLKALKFSDAEIARIQAGNF